MSEYLGIPLYEMGAYGRCNYQVGGRGVTEAEKMAEEWNELQAFFLSDFLEAELARLIHTVAERTREECCREIAEGILTESRIIASNMQGVTNRLQRIIRNAKWEERET